MKKIRITSSCECLFRYSVDTSYETEAGTWMDDWDSHCSLAEHMPGVAAYKPPCAGFLHVDCPLTHGIELEVVDTSRKHCVEQFCFRSDVQLLPGRSFVYACPRHYPKN